MQINGQKWKIVALNASDRRLKRSDNVSVLGVCDNNAKVIYINNRLTGHMLDRVLLHEVCHCFCFEHGINLDMESEEILCDFMATYGREVIGIVDRILWSVRKSS
jgi:predicted metal-dependent hydrolase